jgi:hypothetical protein
MQALDVGLCARNGPASLNFAMLLNLANRVPIAMLPVRVKHNRPIGRLRHQQHASTLETKAETVGREKGRAC